MFVYTFSCNVAREQRKLVPNFSPALCVSDCFQNDKGLCFFTIWISKPNENKWDSSARWIYVVEAISRGEPTHWIIRFSSWCFDYQASIQVSLCLFLIMFLLRSKYFTNPCWAKKNCHWGNLRFDWTKLIIWHSCEQNRYFREGVFLVQTQMLSTGFNYEASYIWSSGG